jgi:hypothetical protein
MSEVAEAPPSLLPPYNPTQTYGNMGYRGAMCDRAIRADNAPMLKECVKHDFIDQNSEMFDGKMILQFCLQEVPKAALAPDGKPVTTMKPRAPQCADMLRSLGWSVPAAKAEAFGIR